MEESKKEYDFNDFKKRAKDNSLSLNEKIGFPDQYRKNFEEVIFKDIVSKMELDVANITNILLDIGCGCSKLTQLFIKHAEENNYKLILVDSSEMLELLPSSKNIEKIPGYFPNIESLFRKFNKKVTHILIYSVLQYIFIEGNIYDFLMRGVNLLSPKGRMLVGDLPNEDKRDRFLLSNEGKEFRKKNIEISKSIKITRDKSIKIDDSIIFSILARFRSLGLETYLLPQNKKLPMENRREDILIIKR